MTITQSQKSMLAAVLFSALLFSATAGSASALTPRQRIQMRKFSSCIVNVTVTSPENCPLYGI